MMIRRTTADGGGISTGKVGGLGVVLVGLLAWANHRWSWGIDAEVLEQLGWLLAGVALWGLRRYAETR